MNKIKFGLKNVHYAVIAENDGTISYGTPERIPGAVSLSLKSSAQVTDIQADDDPAYATVHDNQGYDGDLEVQVLPDLFRVEVLGETVDSNGALVENRDAKPKRIALLFEFDGDEKKTRHILYNVRVSKPDIESNTKGEKIENKTDKLSINATPAKDTGDIKAKVEYGDAPYNNWYNQVYLETAGTRITPDDVVTAGTRITPDDVVFDKKTANQEDVVINILPVASETLSSIKNGSTSLTTTTHYTNTSNTVTIKSTYLATLSVGTHYLKFTFSNSKAANLEIRVIDTTNN